MNYRRITRMIGYLPKKIRAQRQLNSHFQLNLPRGQRQCSSEHRHELMSIQSVESSTDFSARWSLAASDNHSCCEDPGDLVNFDQFSRLLRWILTTGSFTSVPKRPKPEIREWLVTVRPSESALFQQPVFQQIKDKCQLQTECSPRQTWNWSPPTRSHAARFLPRAQAGVRWHHCLAELR